MEAAPFPNDVFGAVDRLTVGEYVSFAGHLARPDDPRPSLPAGALLDTNMKAAISVRFARRFQDYEPRAALSIWIKWYINVIIPPTLLCDLFLRLQLPLSLAHTTFIIGDDARVTAVKICGSPISVDAGDAFDRFGHLIFDHFEPLIELWSARSDVTRRVLWSNVGNTFEAMLAKVEAVSGRTERLDDARWLMTQQLWKGGRPNPIYGAVHYVKRDDANIRLRRICCLQYLLPDRRFCKACPVEEPGERILPSARRGSGAISSIRGQSTCKPAAPRPRHPTNFTDRARRRRESLHCLKRARLRRISRAAVP
jgi:ferric iron reductase protein FhuF